jgi:integrase
MVAEASAVVENWLARLAPTTARMNRYELGYFMAWLRGGAGAFRDYTPDQLVEYQKAATNGHQYDVLDQVQLWVQGLEGRHETKRHRYNAVRSFFVHNRAQLPTDKNFMIRAELPPVISSLSPDDVRRVILSSNPTYRAAFLCILLGGMGQEEFSYWNRTGLQKLRKDLRGDADMIRADMPGRKGSRNILPYYTVVGGDALVALREYMVARPHTSAGTIFVDQRGGPISKPALYMYWSRHIVKTGVFAESERQGNRTGKAPHELRDTFRTLWEKSGAASSVAEFMMGHVVDKDGYNKAHQDEAWVRKEYRKALRYLNIMTSGAPYGLVEEDEIERLRREHREEIDALRKEKTLDMADIEAFVESKLNEFINRKMEAR